MDGAISVVDSEGRSWKSLENSKYSVLIQMFIDVFEYVRGKQATHHFCSGGAIACPLRPPAARSRSRRCGYFVLPTQNPADSDKGSGYPLEEHYHDVLMPSARRGNQRTETVVRLRIDVGTIREQVFDDGCVPH